MSTGTRTSIIFTGGAPGDWPMPEVTGADFVIAADSGLATAERLGHHVDLVVGDLDSATADEVARAEAAGARIERHPAEKDHTDLELALLAARDAGATDVTVVGDCGGRLDHLIGGLLLLGADPYAGLRIEASIGGALVTVVTGTGGARTVAGRPGELVSLLAVGGPALGVRTEGLRYRLDGDDLAAGSSRGISNVLTGVEATVSVDDGTLLIVRPGVEDAR